MLIALSASAISNGDCVIRGGPSVLIMLPGSLGNADIFYLQTGESLRGRLLAAATAPLASLMPLDSFPIAIVDRGDRYDRLIQAILKYVPFKRE
jgi:hypothetical protein